MRASCEWAEKHEITEIPHIRWETLSTRSIIILFYMRERPCNQTLPLLSSNFINLLLIHQILSVTYICVHACVHTCDDGQTLIIVIMSIGHNSKIKLILSKTKVNQYILVRFKEIECK